MPRRFAPRLPTLIFRNVILGGEGGIRTLEGREPLLLFESSAFSHSVTSPYFSAEPRSKNCASCLPGLPFANRPYTPNFTLKLSVRP